MKSASLVGPVVLIVIGTLFLMNNLGFGVPIGYIFRELWPVILIVIGALQIMRAAFSPSVASWGRFTGGVVIVVIGTLFLLQNLFHLVFGRTWPVILIALGVLGLLRYTGGFGLVGGSSSSWKGGDRS